ncbi:hypothetical protein FJZ18_00665 [Candidatus Pacearchaeota archaeon]|nr:hypothetical protein [Candidatus Pacearchaeota archaeon]
MAIEITDYGNYGKASFSIPLLGGAKNFADNLISRSRNAYVSRGLIASDISRVNEGDTFKLFGFYQDSAVTIDFNSLNLVGKLISPNQDKNTIRLCELMELIGTAQPLQVNTGEYENGR